MSARYNKPIVFVDMDDTIVNFRSGTEASKHLHPEEDADSHTDDWDAVLKRLLPNQG